MLTKYKGKQKNLQINR